MDLEAHKVSKDPKVFLVLQEQVVLEQVEQDIPELQDLRDLKEPMVHLELKVHKVLLVLKVLQVKLH